MASNTERWGCALSIGGSLAVLVVLLFTAATGPTTAHPPNSTAHNVSNETFHGLWSKDKDVTGEPSIPNGSPREQLAAGTDIPYSAPPQAIARWNRGDHQEFFETNASVSLHPQNVTLTDKRFIKDAYAATFAIQPSTRALLSQDKQPYYIAPNGTLRGIIDYRVEIPATDTSGDRRTVWTAVDNSIESTTLLVNGTPETQHEGVHTPALSYNLATSLGTTHKLELRATISANVERRTQRCAARDDSDDCTDWTTEETTRFTERVTVTASQDVTEYDLTVSGFVARYPNGDAGVVAYKNRPWLGYRVPDGQVRGVWRLYSARDTAWDRLVYNTGEGSRTIHSPLHPLQLNAYPAETGPTASPVRNVTVLGSYGRTVTPPTLPNNVRLDGMEEPYTASYGIAARVSTAAPLEAVQARGLVRGVTVAQSADAFARVPIHESNLTLQVLSQTAETVTVRAHLRDNQTGAVIATAQRGGWLVIGSQRTNTTLNGTVTVTVDRPLGGVSARYEPGNWWNERVGYTSATATVTVQGSALALLARLFRLLVPVVLFLLAVYLIDRITHWHVWPPWRGL